MPADQDVKLAGLFQCLWNCCSQCKHGYVKPSSKATTFWHSEAFWVFTAFKKGRVWVLSVL